MSNWGDAFSQPSDDVTSGTDYASTCKFNIKPNVPALESRNATPDATNSNGKNALLINIQRALALIAMEAIPSSVLDNVGSGSNAGIFVPDAKWAVGNISMGEYPFQVFENGIVKSANYYETASLFTASEWKRRMDNSRWIPAGKSYDQQNLTVTEVINQINTNPANQLFGTTNKALITENNNKITLTHYSTFVLYSGQYQPKKYVSDVSVLGVPQLLDGPISWPATGSGIASDTLYYVQSFDTHGLFFRGKLPLQKYIGYVKLGMPATATPADSLSVANYIVTLGTASGSLQADLQAYFQGRCFYRGWIRDSGATSAANKILVRRNHIYYLSVTNINGPGIGNPNDIIDPTPSEFLPIEEADTYATAQIRIMNWHIVNQSMSNGLD
jgi:hypothetical protein